ncbi:alpha/beta hydrolase [Deinococcus sp.]|uniref:alpha/beta fold hydrolase n=1 Tax=Deinococcus sp. TaxID=47478 RepID=UPI0025FED11F|nr:alpha/beta hydrolase [Deinococcus sp.]
MSASPPVLPLTSLLALPTVLLPGTLCGAALWAGVALPAGAQVVGAVRGNSLQHAAALILRGAPERFHLLGFSLGAVLAFEVLRRAPERVARLSLLSANPHAPTAAQLEVWAQQEQQVRAGRFGEVAANLAGSSGPHRQTVLDMAYVVGPEAFLEQLNMLRSRPDSRPTLASYSGPLTLNVGQADTVTPPSLVREMAALALQADVQLIPGAGHYLPLDAPQAVSTLLRELAHA